MGINLEMIAARLRTMDGMCGINLGKEVGERQGSDRGLDEGVKG